MPYAEKINILTVAEFNRDRYSRGIDSHGFASADPNVTQRRIYFATKGLVRPRIDTKLWQVGLEILGQDLFRLPLKPEDVEVGAKIVVANICENRRGLGLMCTRWCPLILWNEAVDNCSRLRADREGRLKSEEAERQERIKANLEMMANDPPNLCSARANGWETHIENGTQVVMKKIGPDGRVKTKTFHKAKATPFRAPTVLAYANRPVR